MASEDRTNMHHEERHRYDNSQPVHQFRAQVLRETDRLIYQLKHWSQGRRQTLPFDPRQDYRTNALSNVRKYWIDQGIWNYGWDSRHPRINRFWNHDLHPDLWNRPLITVVTAPAPTPEQEPDANYHLLRSNPNAPQPAPPADPSASRPYFQYLYQVSKEEVWIRDELRFRRLPGRAEAPAKARESVKEFWIEQGIWDPNWTRRPGMEWLFCEPCIGELKNHTE